MRHKILCIDDDETIQTLVEVSLPDFVLVAAKSVKEATLAIEKDSFSAVIIDVQLPDGDGLRFLSQLSQQDRYKDIPALILSSRNEISNKVMAFSLGAEDFITKPFDPIELRARVESKIKKYSSSSDDRQFRHVGNLKLDFSRQKAFKVSSQNEIDLGLTGIELKLLSLFLQRLEQVYSREQIIDLIWGQTVIADRTVDSHIAHLRQKISGTDIEIKTSKSFGYYAWVKV
jgi:two-component system phosphate regulon response regulator PhoB